MKHNHIWLRKEFSKIRDEITRNYVLSTLAKSDEELQKIKHDYCSPVTDIDGCKLIDKILGVNQ